MGVHHELLELRPGSRRVPVESDQPGRPWSVEAGGTPPADAGREPRDTGSPTAGTPTCGSQDGAGTSRRFSRRRLLGAGALAVGTAVLVGPPIARSATSTAVYGLDPDGGREGCGCSACRACRLHAENRLFATAVAADAGRAHPHCRCQVVGRGAVDGSTYDALFVDGGGRSSVDLRHDWVRAVLAAASTAAPVTSPVRTPAGPSSPPASTTVSAGPATPPPQAGRCGEAAPLGARATARLRSVWLRRLGPDRRALFVQLEASAPLEATISLQRKGRRLAHRRVRLAAGRQTVRVPLAATVPKGPAAVRIRFAGDPGTTIRSVSVPAALARRG